MKKFLVVLLACAMIFGFASTALAAIPDQITEFSDIADQSVAAKNAIMKLAVLGVIEGNEGIGGAFRPADNLTRAEFAKIVCYLTGNVKQAEALAGVGSRFSDVSTGNWYTGWVNMAAQSGYFVGDPGGTFRPNANITMQEVVTVCLRAAGYTDKLGNSTGNTVWPGNYINKAMGVGLLDDVTFVGSAAATRSDMAVICEAVLGINMVVHIDNEIAYALALSGGDVDPDGFSEVYYLTNETDKRNEIETILHKAFNGEYYDVQVNPALVSSNPQSATELRLSLEYDESEGWSYADFNSGAIRLNVGGAIIWDDDKEFKDVVEIGTTANPRNWTYEYGEELAETYYITRDFDLTELAGMQVQLTVIDKEEIAFVDVVSSYELSTKIHQDRSDGVTTAAQNIMVGDKSYRASSTMEINGRVANIETMGDYSAGFKTWDATNGAVDMLNLSTSNVDNTFPGKVYLDKDGRIYGVKNYNAYDDTSFGVLDKIDSNRAEWKFDYQSFADAVKFETNKPYTLYKGGEFITAEDLEENDLVSRLGSTSIPFFYVTTPEEGDMTAQNKVNNRLTIDGTVWRLIHAGDFAYSDDGGETFTGINVSNDDIEFGTAQYAKAYNFFKLGYVAGNVSNNKIIGVITKVEPAQVWSAGGATRDDRYEEVTIYNAEGKEVTYKFTTAFRDAYNWYATQVSGHTFKTGSSIGQADWDKVKNAGANMGSRQSNAKGETMTTLLAKGDIIQLVVDKDDKVKRLDNYAAFTTANTASAKVSSSNSRMTLSGAGSTTGTYTINDDAIVFNVTPDGADYDDVAIQSVSSVLAKDFDASKIVAFDVKTGARVAVLYIIDDTSVYQYGIISGQGRDSTGYYFMVNDAKVYASDAISNSYIPGVISYTVSGGEATPSRITGLNSAYLAIGKNGGNTYFNDVQAAVAAEGDTNTKAVVGVVDSYASSTKALQIGSTYVYITDSTYLYDLLKDDDVSTPADLKGKMVMAFYDKDNNAYFVARVGTDGNGGGTSGGTPVVPPTSTVADLETVAGNTIADLTWSAATGATGITVQASLDGTNWYTLRAGAGDAPVAVGSAPAVPADLNDARAAAIAAPATATSAQVTGLLNGVEYFFRLNVVGGSFAGLSNVDNAVARNTPIRTLTATSGNAIATLNWIASGAVAAADVQVSVDGTNWYVLATAAAPTPVGTAPATLPTGISANTFISAAVTDINAGTVGVSGLANGTTYQFRLVVAAGTFAGTSNVADVKPLNAIGNLLAVPDDGEVALTWTAAIGATAIKLQVSTDNGTTWTDSSLSIATNAASATVTGLTNGTSYRFRLVVTGGENEGNSNVVNATPIATIDGAYLANLITDAFVQPVNGATVGELNSPSVAADALYTIVGHSWMSGVTSGKFDNGGAAAPAVYTIVLKAITGYEFDAADIAAELDAAFAATVTAAGTTTITITITYTL